MARDAAERRAYPSDLTDAQWALIEPLIPKCKSGGRPEAHSRRELVNAMLYVLHNGCTWRALPHDLPPWPTVYTYFRQWRMSGLWKGVNDHLRSRVRLAAGRETLPRAAIMDSQSARTTEKGGPAAGTATNA
jgi:transposase